MRDSTKEQRVHQAAFIISAFSSLFGVALMLRYGVTLHSRLEFSRSLPPSFSLSTEAWSLHGRELRGRLGLLLVVIGAAMAGGATGTVWLPL